MKIHTIIGGVNGVGKSSFIGVLKELTTDLGIIIDTDKLAAELGGDVFAGDMPLRKRSVRALIKSCLSPKKLHCLAIRRKLLPRKSKNWATMFGCFMSA